MFLVPSVILLLCVHRTIVCLDQEITVSIEAGRRDCFFEQVHEGEVIDFEYQVIDGGHGDLDITFNMLEPGGRVLHVGFKKQEQGVQSEAQVTGDYEFCFDNTFSAYNAKTVFFELLIDRAEDAWSSDERVRKESFVPEDVELQVQVQDIEEMVNVIRGQITRVRQLQELIKSNAARDRNVAEENYFKVNCFSISQLIVMLAVGVIQVVMLKSLFDSNSTVHKLWQKLITHRR